MLAPVRKLNWLQKQERSPLPINIECLEVWCDAMESTIYTRHHNYRPRRGMPVNKLPAMLRTLNDHYSLGGILCALYKRYGYFLEWIPGYNGKIAEVTTYNNYLPQVRSEQFYVPRPVLEWAFKGEGAGDLEWEKLQDFIYRIDQKISFTNKWPRRGQMFWWFWRKVKS